LLYRFMPESVSFLLAKDRKGEAEELTRRFDLPIQSEIADSVRKEGEASTQKSTLATLRQVFSKRCVAATLIFMVASFQGLLLVYGLNTWLPGIVREARYLLSSSLSFLLVLNVGAIVGALLASSAAARYDSKPLTVICCLLSATSVGLLSIQPPALVVYVLAALAGLGSIGPQIFVNAWVTRYYPVDSRSRWEALISVSPAWSTIITSSEQK
jgi:AAHS family benzoate transporter-like MFS transporter